EVVAALPDDAALRRTALDELVHAWESAVDDAVARGELALPALPARGADLASLAAPEVPESVSSLRAAYDALLPVLERDEDVARTLLRAALLDLRYARLDPAEAGLRAVLAD